MEKPRKFLPDHSVSLLAIGVLLLATFPLLGNALALPIGLPRRPLQLFVLLGSFGLLLPALLPATAIPASLRQGSRWGLGMALGTAIVSAISQTQWPGGEAFFKWGWLALWLSVSVSVLLCLRQRPQSAPPSPDTRRLLFRGLALVGWGLAFVVWWTGPETGQVLIRLGGSEIIVAVCAAVGLFTSLYSLPWRQKLLACPPYAYLLIFSTSRTGVLLLPVLTAVVSLAVLCRPATTARRLGRTAGHLLFLGLLFLGLVAPIGERSPAYPFRAFHVDPNEVTFRTAEFYKRSMRSLRAMHTVGVIEISADPNAPGLGNAVAHYLVRKIAELEGDLAYRLIPDARGGELRWKLLVEAAQKTAATPLGHWPVAYRHTTALDCGKNVRCNYPHNLLLEFGYHWGWLPLLTLLVALIGFGARSLWDLARSGNATLEIIAIAWWVHLTAVQTTGTLRDHFIPLVLMALWLVFTENQRRQAAP